MAHTLGSLRGYVCPVAGVEVPVEAGVSDKAGCMDWRAFVRHLTSGLNPTTPLSFWCTSRIHGLVTLSRAPSPP